MRKRVIYRAEFEAVIDVDVEEGESDEERAQEIDIPEGGLDRSEYRCDTFEIIRIEDA